MPVNWKTTLMGIVFGIALNANTLGLPEKWVKPITGIAAIVWAATQKDKDVTGAGMTARRVDDPPTPHN